MTTTTVTNDAPATSKTEARFAVAPLVLKASVGTHIVLAVFCMLPFIFALAPQLLDRPPMPELLVIGVVVAFVGLVWVRSFRIELTARELRYRSLFGGSRSIAFDAIANARIQVGARGAEDRWKPHYRLVITPRDGTSARPIVVNLKVFAFEPLKRVCAAVDAELDDGAA
ncbi:MAG: hypothetical protein HZA53_18705 [Planctomycetes bacterium]|nr:hypothetical protein [Planctomycetota bacterium]